MTSENSSRDIPFLTADQMREVDRAMVEDYQILLIQMMENAGRNLADLARRRFLGGNPVGRRVLVLAGTGGNGGGGLVCARRLHAWGASVRVLLAASPDRFTEIPRHQLTILENMCVSTEVVGEEVKLAAADLVIDSIIGYSLRGTPSGPAASLIYAANAHGAPILALDVPSGVEATNGLVHDPSIRATATLTLALPKAGLRTSAARSSIGELYIGDISVPRELYANPPLNLTVPPLFAEGEIVRVY